MKRSLILKTGQEYAITGESGKYYICGDGIQFRKASADIDYIKEISDPKKGKEEKWENIPEDEVMIEEEKSSAKKTRSRTASKKKGEDK